MNCNTECIKGILLTQRNFFMGVAMILIVLFHLSSGYKIQPLETIFSRGFYGVDLFLFFSALGLCFSFNNNSLSKFYYNRVKRVIPLFVCLVLFRIIWHLANGGTISVWDFIVTFTGLSYFKILGGLWIDWYMCALLILYATFPLIYKYIVRTGWHGLVVVSAISTFLCLVFPLYWEHACLIGRLPIFCAGIIFYLIVVRKTMPIKMKIATSLLMYGFFLFIVDISFPNGRTKFLAPSFFTPFLIYVIAWCYKYLINKTSILVKTISFIGEHSLEIYIANLFSIYLCQRTEKSIGGYTGVIIELSMIIILSILLFYINKYVIGILFRR